MEKKQVLRRVGRVAVISIGGMKIGPWATCYIGRSIHILNFMKLVIDIHLYFID